MEGLLERLARLSLKKAGQLSKYGGTAAGGALAGPPGAFLGNLAGSGIKSAFDALAQTGYEPQYMMHPGQVQNPQEQQGFGQNYLRNLGNELGGLGSEYFGGGYEAPQPKSNQDLLDELFNSLTPEEQAKFISKYGGGQ